MITGFTNGCFDLLHAGHLHFLRECRRHCAKLVVGVDADGRVAELKGAGRPVDRLTTRIWNLWASGLTDSIVPFGSASDLRFLIVTTAPDILFKGREYEGQPVAGEDLVSSVILINMLPGFSTTAQIEKKRA